MFGKRESAPLLLLMLRWVPGLGEVSDDTCYRAMDLLLAIEAEVAE